MAAAYDPAAYDPAYDQHPATEGAAYDPARPPGGRGSSRSGGRPKRATGGPGQVDKGLLQRGFPRFSDVRFELLRYFSRLLDPAKHLRISFFCGCGSS